MSPSPVILLLGLFTVCFGERTSLVYKTISNSFPCFRKQNGTHETGCASSLNGDVGVLHLVMNDDDLNWVIEDGPHSPYVPMLYASQLSRDIMLKFKSTDRVKGVIVLHTESTKLEGFSPDRKCPNKGFGLFKNPDTSQCDKWNPIGNGLLFERFEFPMFYIKTKEESKNIVDCFEKYNKPVNGTPRDWPLCAAQLKSFMFAAVDTPTCLRRSKRFNFIEGGGGKLGAGSAKVCDPLGDWNIWASLSPTNQSDPFVDKVNGSVIIISAKLDSASLFDTLAYGADAASTGVVALLATLNHLKGFKEVLREASDIRNIYFMLFNGEAFGYIGSSKVVYDMKNGSFPADIIDGNDNAPALLGLDDIKYFIELGSVGVTSDSSPYFLHSWGPGAPGSDKISTMLQEDGTKYKLDIKKRTYADKDFPPSSLQSFIAERSSVPGVVISNYDDSFKNRYYHSVFDDAAGLNYIHQQGSLVSEKIANLSATVATTILRLVKPGSKDIEPDFKFVDDLLQCYTVAANCSIFANMSMRNEKYLPSSPFDMYVGVYDNIRLISSITRNIMIALQGQIVGNVSNSETCLAKKKTTVAYRWVNNSCFETTVTVDDAVSPAFLIDDYDWKSGQYSSWTESVWHQYSLRIFLKPSRIHEIITLVSGIIIFLISFGIVGWLNTKTDSIFPTRPSGVTC